MKKGGSYYSQIEIVTKGNDKFIDKTLHITGSREYAEEVRRKVLLQRSAFTEKNIPISELVNIEVISEGQKHFLKMREKFAGLDFMDIVDEDNAEMYINRILNDIYTPLLSEFRGAQYNEDFLLKAGIDPVMRNFVFDNKIGRFRYVDFLPPKVYFKGEYSQEIPELTNSKFKEIRKFCHNDPGGIMYVTYLNLVRVIPAKRKRIAALIEQFLKDQDLEQLLEPMHKSPVYRVHDREKMIKFIDQCNTWEMPNYYYLREIANWIYSESPDSESVKEAHRQVFKLTHHVTNPDDPEYGQVSDKNFKKIKEILINEIKSS